MTNVYDRWVLPRLINLVMQNKMDTAERAKFVPRSSGVVLEIGAGSGLNIPFYSHRGIEGKESFDSVSNFGTWPTSGHGARDFPSSSSQPRPNTYHHP